MSKTDPTPYPDVNAVLRVLLAGVQEVLGPRLVGLYVSGSLASGDFCPPRSDVDFVAVTDGVLPGDVLPALEAMHARITASGLKWAAKLEGPYVPRRALRRYEPDQAWDPSLRVDGSFGVDGHGSDWVIQLYTLREQGVVLVGPEPQTLIDPILPDDLRRAALATLHEWWAPMLHDPARLHSREYQAYAALTMCRALYTLQHGTVGSKTVAARWTQETLGETWAALIDQALAWPSAPQVDSLDATLDFVRYTLKYSRP